MLSFQAFGMVDSYRHRNESSEACRFAQSVALPTPDYPPREFPAGFWESLRNSMKQMSPCKRLAEATP